MTDVPRPNNSKTYRRFTPGLVELPSDKQNTRWPNVNGPVRAPGFLLGVYTSSDRRTDRSVRLVCPTSRMKRLHVPIVGLTGLPDPGYVRLVGQTSRTDQSDTESS